MNEPQLPDNAKRAQQKGTITLAAMLFVLVTLLTLSALPNLSAIISSGLKDVIVAVVAAQVASQSSTGRREKR